MAKPITKRVKDFCSDKNGKVTLAQSPNLPIVGWIVFKLIAIPISNQPVKTGFESLATAFLFVWAYLEIFEGDSNFRRLLGALIMALVVFNMFTV
jgi:hypothetical protein